MTASHQFLLLIAALMLLLSGSDVHAVNVENTVSYYGRLQLHQNYFNHPHSEDPLWLMQGGEVIISNAQHTIRVPTSLDGSFVVFDLPYGAYHLHAEYAHFIYPTIRLDITEKTMTTGVIPVIRTYTNDGTMTPVQGTGLDEESPAVIPYASTHMYYIPREQYSVMDFLKNPMILMMLVSMGMVGMMKMLPEEDRRESAKELQKLQKQWSGKPVPEEKKPQFTTGKEKKKN